MSERSRGDPSLMNTLDRLLSEYAEKCNLEDEVDIYLKDKSGSKNEELNCRFRDNCYTFRSKMGTCPCELNV